MGILRNFYLLFEEAGDGSESVSFTGGSTETTQTTETTETTEEIIGKGTFYEGLEKDLFEDPSLKAFMDDSGTMDAKNLIKSYVHAKRQLGKDKVVIPGEHATDTEWREIFTKLGLPDTPEKYGVAPKDEKFFNPDFVADFTKTAYQNGILPKQAQGMLDWYQDQVASREQEIASQAKEDVEAEINSLKKDWGQAYDKNLNLAKKAYQTFADEKLTEAIEKQGLHTNPTLLRLFAKIGNDLTTEGTIKGDNGVQSDPYTTSEVEDKIKEYMSEPAYWDKKHPSHATITKKVNRLYSQMG